MKKVLFLIHDLGRGGAEKVLINLVNHMDRSQFDITVMALFAGGVNEPFLTKDIRYITCFKKAVPGNSHLMKLLSPRALHKWLIKDHYDIEISYLEGPSARIISGCPDLDTQLISWVHSIQHDLKTLSKSYRSIKEARTCCDRFDRTICVSQYMKADFCSVLDFKKPCDVLYNTVDSEMIQALSSESVCDFPKKETINLIAVGTLKEVKGYERLLRVTSRLVQDGLTLHLYILGRGPLEQGLKMQIKELAIQDNVTMLGYHTNPYKYVAKCDLFVCSSYSEGFSTAATESLIVGTPVCTVKVSGMKEMLGENNEYGIVTENDEEALYQGIKQFFDNPELLNNYKQKALERGKMFSTQKTVAAVEEMLKGIL